MPYVTSPQDNTTQGTYLSLRYDSLSLTNQETEARDLRGFAQGQLGGE